MDWSNRPSEQRQQLGDVRRRGWQPIKEGLYQRQSESLKDDIRGLKLSQLRVEKDIQTEKLEQKNIQLGTEKETTKQVKEKFVQATYKTVIERTKTAKTLDQSALETRSWQPEQQRLQTSLESVQLSQRNEAEKLSLDRRVALAEFN